LGFSTGLLYSPGNSAAREELLALGAIVAERDGVWATHLRSEGDGLLESLDEFISIGMEAGCRKLHISHLKTAGRANWSKLDDALARISRAASEGVRITADRYPYVESMTSLSVFMPSPYSDMDDSSLMELLNTPDGFAVFADAASNMPESRWSTLRIVSTSANPAPAIFADCSELRGHTIAELADATGIPPWDICAVLLRDDAPGTTAASKGMSESNMRRILAQPFVCCCTDETARPADFSFGASHPRAYGSFPKFIRTLMPELPIGEIVRKMTSLPAEIFGLSNRGAITAGSAADLVLIDPDVVATAESATFADPHKKAAGIARVWVNGSSARLAEDVL
jgi:N-acyl-D-amino-acid deacylase